MSYALQWIDEHGETQNAIMDKDDELSISVARGRPLAVVAYPVCLGQRFRPAAGLYPFDLEDTGGKLPSGEPDMLEMSFASGYAAEAALCIEKAGRNPWAFPVEKLPSAWKDGASDPWSLPPWKCAQALIDGTFRKSLFRGSAIQVALPSDCLWWAESPFCGFVESGSGQTALLHEGISIFFCAGNKLVVCVDKGKTTMQRGELSE